MEDGEKSPKNVLLFWWFGDLLSPKQIFRWKKKFRSVSSHPGMSSFTGFLQVLFHLLRVNLLTLNEEFETFLGKPGSRRSGSPTGVIVWVCRPLDHQRFIHPRNDLTTGTLGTTSWRNIVSGKPRYYWFKEPTLGSTWTEYTLIWDIVRYQCHLKVIHNISDT